MPNDKLPSWSIPVEELFQSFNSSESGLTEEEASLRLKKYGANSLKPAGQPSGISLFLRKFKSPITLIFLAAAILSIFLKQHTDASIILVIVIASDLLSFWISSVCDYITFFVLLKILHAGRDQFRTGWFIESIISASLIVLVIRTRKPFVRSRPGKYLAVISLTIVLISLAVPLTPLKNLFDFTGLPAVFNLALLIIVVCYILTAEIAKHLFFRKGKVSSGQK